MSLWVNARPKIRPLVLLRDDFTCQECGLKPNNISRLHCHHIIPNSDHSLDNLITLCMNCHGKTHVFNKSMKKDWNRKKVQFH